MRLRPRSRRRAFAIIGLGMVGLAAAIAATFVVASYDQGVPFERVVRVYPSALAVVGMVGAVLFALALVDVLRRRRFVVDAEGVHWRMPHLPRSVKGSVAWGEIVGAHREWTTHFVARDEGYKEVRVEWLVVVTRDERHRVRWQFREDSEAVAKLIWERAQSTAPAGIAQMVRADPHVAPRVSRRLSWLTALGGSALGAAPAVLLAATLREAVPSAVVGAVLLVFPFVLVPLRRRLASRSRIRAIGRRAEALYADGPRADAAAGPEARGTVRRGRVRCLAAVWSPGGGTCAAYVARVRDSAGRYCVRSAAGTIELEMASGRRVTLTAGPWRVADPFDRTTVAGEARIHDGTEIVACGGVERAKGGGGFRAAAGPETLSPGLLMPVTGAFPYRVVGSRDGSEHVVRVVFVLAALAAGLAGLVGNV